MDDKIQISDILAELRRELAMRERLYPDWIAAKKLSAKTAAWRLTMLRSAIQLIEIDERYIRRTRLKVDDDDAARAQKP